MKRKIAAALMMPMMLLGVSGCSADKNDNNVELTMYLWDKSMTKELTPWLEQKFPEIDFTFVVGYNTDVAGSFYDSYLENNREPGGAVRWLPMCAEVDGYIANADLFEECGIAIPANYSEFADACGEFDELGLRCYVNDYREDYSCMEALQGCGIPELMTMDGTMWREKYESEIVEGQVGLDDKVWPAVFDKFQQYVKDTMIRPEDIEMSFAEMKSGLLESKTAIMRGTASDCAVLREENGLNVVMLPYFGESSEDNWLLTYPACQVAVNKDVEQDGKKLDAVSHVLEAMFSEEGQRHVATDNAVLSYNKNVNIEINDVFSQVKDCIDRNHLYMRLASAEMFAVSKNVVQKMITGEYGAEEAYDDFIEDPNYCNCPMPAVLNDKFVSGLEGGRQLEQPSEYVTVLG